MRCLPLILAAALAAAPAAAQELGERTRSPESMLAELGLAPDADDLDEAIAAAAAHPLGTAENPVRVGGPDGERAYIARLRCADGSAPRTGQRGSAGVGAFGTIVDAYPLDCGAAAPGQVTLVMDMYHSEHREDRAPPGFTLSPR
ncbi:hypothetical protein [Sphingosinicella terrae]|jgi:hypothetical protein|uniref:hypothetical protein n=1 Tax=Sphingosinicella terrae TaxID=2172047 RepID=UPI000E0D8239|nr:hypothetical protein [Sphingosinicella terrae]